MELERTFPGVGGARSHFWFVRATWFGETENENGGKPDARDMDDLAAALRDYDIVVFNSGWWDIKDYRGGSGSAFEYSRGYGNCGNEWTDLCRKSYARDVELAIDKLLAPAEVAIFRSSSCCGDYAGRPDGRSVAAMNEIAERKAKNAGVEYARPRGLVRDGVVSGGETRRRRARATMFAETTTRAEAEAVARIFRGDANRGDAAAGDAEILRRRHAAMPRPRRGRSGETTTRGDAAAARRGPRTRPGGAQVRRGLRPLRPGRPRRGDGRRDARAARALPRLDHARARGR